MRSAAAPSLLITACAFFLKGRRIGIRWSIVCMLTMVLVELLPAPYAKGIYGTLTSILDIVALILLLSLYEHQKQQDSEALARNEEKFRTIFNSSNDAIFPHRGRTLLAMERSSACNVSLPGRLFRGSAAARSSGHRQPAGTARGTSRGRKQGARHALGSAGDAAPASRRKASSSPISA